MSRRKKPFNRGRWQVERERFHIPDARPSDDKAAAVPVGDAVAASMRQLGLEEPHWVRRLEAEWLSLVGDSVAKHARPGRYERGRLVVFVDSAVWLNELKRYGQARMLENLQNRFGVDKIKSLSLQPDPDGQPGSR